MRKWINIIEGKVVPFRQKQPRRPIGEVSSYRLGDWVVLDGEVGQIIGYVGHKLDRDLFRVRFENGDKTVSHVNLVRAKVDGTLSEGDHTPAMYDADDKDHYDALDKTGFFGAQGAGCIAMARSTGRIMLVLRSYQVEQPFTFGNVGGAHAANENPIDAALRELYEETGYIGATEMHPLLVFKSGSFRYSNFLAIVEDEFIPDLGWEATEYKWVTYGQWPRPLHFGLQSLFSDPESAKIIKSYASLFSGERTQDQP